MKMRVVNSRQSYAAVVLIAVMAASVAYVMASRTSHVVSYEKSDRVLKHGELPNQQKPDREVVATYKPAQTYYPKAITISRLGMAARIIDVGKTGTGDIESPANIYDVGWVRTTSLPSASTGFMALVGYVKGNNQDGIFAQLSQLRQGDGIIIESGDGKISSFLVLSSKDVASSDSLANTLLAPKQDAEFELRLTSITGPFEKPSLRRLVTAKRQ